MYRPVACAGQETTGVDVKSNDFVRYATCRVDDNSENKKVRFLRKILPSAKLNASLKG